MKSANYKNKGFTLVELSIVIVIIGFIISAVTAGQSIVKSSQLRSILTQAEQVRSAINAFKNQYNGLPGDLINGFSYWPTCGASTAVCNGDNNKQITILATKTGTQQPEGYIAWWELDAANLFPGEYTIPASGAGALTGTILGSTNPTIPPAKYSGAGMTIGYDTVTSGINMLSTTASLNKNIILFGATRGTGNIANKGFLTTTQASSLDAKADDGNAVAGNIYAGESTASARGTGTCASAAGAYTTGTTSTTSCTIAFAIIK